MRLRLACSLAVACALVAAVPLLRAQLATRADDPLGFSSRAGRVQIVHSSESIIPGTSMALQRRDPWLAYMLGRDYFEREWSAGDQVYLRLPEGRAIGGVNSCAMCHNLPFRSPGFGGNAGDPGFGRNAPHLFGVGLLETLAIQIRAEILDRFDKNHNGFLDHPAETAGKEAVVEAAPGVPIDFGPLDDRDGDGLPDLNPVLRVAFVDGDGRLLAPRNGVEPSLDDPRAAGYDFSVAFLSASVSDHQFSSLRAFTIGVMQTLMGIQTDDPTIANDAGAGRDRRAHDGWAETSNAGAPQLVLALPASAAACARLDRVSEGELDLFEWYLMNHPPPAQRGETESAQRGRALMAGFGCTRCHVPEWRIRPADEARGFPGDRRFFDLEVRWNAAHARFEGKLHPLVDSLYNRGAAEQVPAHRGAVVHDVFTDLRHHDLGARFYEYSSVGGQLYVTKRFRTPPLWGVGSTAPYGHDGRSAKLDDVIRRHGGEAEDAAYAYAAASDRERRDLIAFLSSLVLYSPDTLPADLDGDGTIAERFLRQGQDLGAERFWPELLFAGVPRYRGWTIALDGSRYFSLALLNTDELYARNAPALTDRDGNGVPDAVQCAPGLLDNDRIAPSRTGLTKGGKS